MEKHYEIWTDGGCRKNPGIGGWASILLCDGIIVDTLSGNDELTTNNKMELIAIINGVKRAIKLGASHMTVYADSQYCINGITKWVPSWKVRGWVTKKREPIKNRELWEELDSLCENLNISFNWVKGHDNVKYNEMCDVLVNQEMDKLEESN